MINRKFFCQCGNVVGIYQIKDGLGGIGINLTSCCCNYCSECGSKIDKEKFKKKLDFDVKRCINYKKEEKELLENLMKGLEND